jgi:undecaprenyl-diphosphatase
MNPTLDLAFDVACHVGTLLAVVVFFWSEIIGMLRALPQALRRDATIDGRRVRFVALGTIPIVIVGALGAGALEETLRTPAVAAASLAVGAVLLLVAERVRPLVRLEAGMTARDALVIGVSQALALIPGVSRSGITMTSGMLLGFQRREVARFTFLLCVPAILAAAAKNALELRGATLTTTEMQAFGIGLLTSAVVGYLAIRFFIRFVGTHRLDVFAWYRLALAAILVIVLMSRQP